MAPDPGEITLLLAEFRNGNQEAASRLIAFVYDELRRLAAHYVRGERSNITLQPTALVHEAYLRLVRDDDLDWQNRAHFLGVAAQLMRRVLIDHARARNAAKRGHGQKVQLEDDVAGQADRQSADLIDLDRALERLAATDARLARTVELRYFGGLSVEETAEVLGVSSKTVKRDWAIAKAWLKSEIGAPHANGGAVAEN